MNRNTERNRRLVIAAMLGAITVVLSLTPLGLIPLGVINATTMHIPVIIGAIAEGALWWEPWLDLSLEYHHS